MSSAIILNKEIITSRRLTLAIGVAFFALATAFGAYIRIPVPGTPVPITLQTLFVMLSGAVLGKKLGLISQASYLGLGLAGIPVFQGSGFGSLHLLGPTGGYLLGFMAASFLAGKMLEKRSYGLYAIAGSFIAAVAVLYSFGIVWLIAIYRMSPATALMIGLMPFLAAEFFKIWAAILVYSAIAGRSKNIFS